VQYVVCSSMCPHSSVFRPSLHSPSTAQDFHSFAGRICCKGLADLRPCDHTDLGPRAIPHGSQKNRGQVHAVVCGPGTQNQGTKRTSKRAPLPPVVTVALRLQGRHIVPGLRLHRAVCQHLPRQTPPTK